MTEQNAKLAPVLIQLFKGILYRDQSPELWQDMTSLHAQALDYLAVIGLELYLDEAEGYAYLRQGAVEEGEENGIPRLIRRRPLSYPVSLLCVLLRKKLAEADAGGEDTRVVLSREQILDLLRIFLPQQSNEARIVEQIDTHINKVVEYGFLRKLKSDPPAYEVRRIIKSLVDADWLADLDEKLAIYHGHAERIL